MASVMKLEPTTEEDLQRISDWNQADEYHRGNNLPEWWLTGQGSLAFRLDDEQGPVLYVRLDDGELCRLHCQFAPQDVVDKKRVILNIVGILPWLLNYARSKGSKGMVFNSVSPKLVKFMKKMGFEPSWEHFGEHVLTFEER
jgi:hypothetical protein